MFCNRLRALRGYHNLTQRHIAQSLIIDRSTYAYYETGKTHPDFETLTRIARMFGVSTDYLLGLDESPARSVIKAIPGMEDSKRDMGPERMELARSPPRIARKSNPARTTTTRLPGRASRQPTGRPSKMRRMPPRYDKTNIHDTASSAHLPIPQEKGRSVRDEMPKQAIHRRSGDEGKDGLRVASYTNYRG